ADRAEVRRRVRIGGDAHLQLLGGEVPAPDGGPVGEEALVAGQAVDHRILGALGGALHGVVGGGQAAQVGDVLAEGELAVDVQARGRLVAVELLHQLVGAGQEALGIGVGPPV